MPSGTDRANDPTPFHVDENPGERVAPVSVFGSSQCSCVPHIDAAIPALDSSVRPSHHLSAKKLTNRTVASPPGASACDPAPRTVDRSPANSDFTARRIGGNASSDLTVSWPRDGGLRRANSPFNK